MNKLVIVAVICSLMVVALAAPYPHGGYYDGYYGYDENRDRLDDRSVTSYSFEVFLT